MGILSPILTLSLDSGSDIFDIKRNTARKRKAFSCTSCKRLKIKCDKKRPSCEYCEYRGKKCQYPDDEELQMVKLNPHNLNSTTHMMNLSFEELLLLKFYDNHHMEILGVKEGTPRYDIWRYQVPRLVNESPIIKESIFGLSSLAMLACIDIDKANDVYITADSNHSLYYTINEYFHSQVTALNELCLTLNESRNNNQIIKWNDKQIVEILVLNYTFYIFCCLHPHEIIPLVHFYDGSGIVGNDILGVTKGFLSCINHVGLGILESRYASILFIEERKLQLPSYQLNYKPIESLRQYLSQYRSYLTRSDYDLYDNAIRYMELAIYRCFKFNYMVPMFRWMFFLDERFLDYLRSRHVFALKIMYIYSTLCQYSGFNIDEKSNVWMKYMIQYKEMGYMLSNGLFSELLALIWWDEYDQRLFELADQNFRGHKGIEYFEEILSLMGMDDKIISMDSDNFSD